ncbi:MAG: Gfo/Idh/MocA family oxidoreductase [Sphaerochaetaceae bacterium]|nr:Gfo/Idh/MocA family oxidoreductase [Sphaerochaetaceae bacterium]MDC7238557.1 Gfo/Idh/MocA family oxidoreductase [Sphaerochaetaceae bacterium]MDC7249295.1 Gfo/Idh/MocA family oxidoreductase [Sphaerochaetaceae bacterium]
MINIGIIGTGAISRIHIDSYKKFSDKCSVVAICDTVKEKAELLCEEKGLDAKIYTDVNKMLEDETIDAISICLPPSLHSKFTILSLDAKKHVLCEKPMATSIEECDLMVDAVSRNKKILSIVSQNRYKDEITKVKQILDSGKLGKIHFANFNSLWWRSDIYYHLKYRGTWQSDNGGCTMNHSIHYIDLMIMLFGKPKSVRAYFNNLNHKNSECEDISIAIFEYEDKVITFNSSLLSHGEKQSITIDGENAGISIPWNVNASKTLANGFPLDDEEKAKEINDLYNSLDNLKYKEHDAQILHFLNAIENPANEYISQDDGKNTIEVVMALYKAAQEETRVNFPIEKDDPYYKKETMIGKMTRFNEKEIFLDSLPNIEISLGRDFSK